MLRANAEHGGEHDLPEGQRGRGLSRTTVSAGNGKSSGKRGVLSFCRKMLTPKAAQRAKKAVPASPCPQPSYRHDRAVTAEHLRVTRSGAYAWFLGAGEGGGPDREVLRGGAHGLE